MAFLDDLKELVDIQSPSEDLEACARVVEGAIAIAARNLPSPAYTIEAGGRPIFWWGSKNPEIVLLCHLDTVWPVDSYLPLWKEDGDQIFGPGIFDMKAGFLQAMYAVKELIGSGAGAEEKIALVGTTDEEIGSHASRALIEELARNSKAVLVFESSIDDTVKIGRKGTSMYRITVHGRAAHAGLEPEKGINATTEISRIALAMQALENSEHGTTVVPTVMQSGSTTNTVPATAILDIDARSFLSSELVRVDQAIRALSAHHPEATLEITGGINRPPLEHAATADLYQLIEKVAADLGMPKVGHVSVGGASDGNLAAAVGGKVLDGLGASGHGAHAAHEHILVSRIEPRIKLVAGLLKELING
jgi:glutamate carboxypeptidase